MTRVAVIGGGIAGLATAHALAGRVDVVVFEADERLGGKIRTSAFAGRPVDEGADAFLARVPWATDLCHALGLGDRIISPTGSGAYVYARGKLRPIPDAVVMGVPSQLGSVVRSGVLSPRGMVRAALEPVMPRRHAGDNVGRLVRQRFGDEVNDYLVDPLVGGIYAGADDDMSIAATTPQLIDASRHRSMLLALRHQQRTLAGGGSRGAVFHSLQGGLGVLIEAMANALDAGGVEVRLGRAVGAVGLDGTVDGEPFDAVVLATPAPVTARLLRPIVPDAAQALGTIPMASVAMVTLAVPDHGFARHLDATGFLVPRPERRHVTACSWFTTKWGQYSGGGSVVLRASVGAADAPGACDLSDDVLVDQVGADLRQQMGLRTDPSEVRITRWRDAFPQYQPGHLERVADIERAVAARSDRLFLTGATYRGVGIPACVRQGQETAARIVAR